MGVFGCMLNVMILFCSVSVCVCWMVFVNVLNCVIMWLVVSISIMVCLLCVFVMCSVVVVIVGVVLCLNGLRMNDIVNCCWLILWNLFLDLKNSLWLVMVRILLMLFSVVVCRNVFWSRFLLLDSWMNGFGWVFWEMG